MHTHTPMGRRRSVAAQALVLAAFSACSGNGGTMADASDATMVDDVVAQPDINDISSDDVAPDVTSIDGDAASPIDASAPDGAVDAALDAGADAIATDSAQPSCIGVELPVVQTADPIAATRGATQFTDHVLGHAMVPRMALRYLWLVWGTGSPPTDAAYWQAFRARYGVYDAPFPNDGYPLGIRAVDANNGTFDCMLCHATVTAGRTLIGVGNSQLDLQGLFDDLRALAAMFGYPTPWMIDNRTAASGANDAFGLGMFMASMYASGSNVHTRAGYQQAAPWWTLRYRHRMYSDGSGAAGGYRTMMATLLASGETLTELQAQDGTFADIYQYLLSLQPPCWDLTTIDATRRERGRVVFESTCASCHGTHNGSTAMYPDRVIPSATVGTDPVRAASFDANDARFVNASWFGADHPMTATGGYLAPPLAGVWATAPYFHNGSVPDLAGVIHSPERPTRWRRTGSAASDYDASTVGWRYTTVATSPGIATIDARKTYDTTQPGLGNGGHTFGDSLTDAQRSDLLEYLRSL